MKIVFTNSFKTELDLPKPASKVIPEWYKTSNSYIGDNKKPAGNGSTTATIKKCMPVFDAMTAGYIIELPADVYVSIKDGSPWFEWADLNLIDFHPIDQAANYPKVNSFPIPKWMNPWGIATPKGYSTLFVQPFHRETVFTILPGLVDTDSYKAPINFPFVLNNVKFEGLIPKGTPIAQVIPIKREFWKMSLGSQKDLELQEKTRKKIQSMFFDKYKTIFWAKKEYK